MSILHADVDAFFASVAQRDDPSLRGRPVIVGSWVVMAASYEARAYGVRGGMPAVRAKRLCPDAITVSSSWEAYRDAGEAVIEVLRRSGAVVQRAGIEEAFLDAGALDEPSAELAARLRREVRDEVGLPLSVGVARTKVLAKIASREAKPDGLFVVESERELAFLHGLPVERIWGVGAATAAKLHARGLRRVRQVAELSEGELMRILGKAAGRYVHAIAHNREPRPFQRRRGRRSMGAQRALGRRPRTRAELEEALDGLAERIAKRMEGRSRAGRTVVLRLRFGDYSRITRSTTLAHPTGDAAVIASAARDLLDATMPLVERRGATLVGITVTNLDDDSANQLALPLGDAPPAARPDT